MATQIANKGISSTAQRYAQSNLGGKYIFANKIFTNKNYSIIIFHKSK